LAAHYRFGARTAGSNLMIGCLFLSLVFLLGDEVVSFFHLLPLSILGVLLIFTGSQLTLTMMDLRRREEFFVAVLILGITLASNLAIGFVVGLLVGLLVQSRKLKI
jgi:SulP family sulfate permease